MVIMVVVKVCGFEIVVWYEDVGVSGKIVFEK